MKESYIDAINKRAAQDITLVAENKRIIGLGGPDIKEYVAILRSKGFEEIIIFEDNYEVYRNQIRQFPDCELIHGDIRDHLREDAFYDLDFCCSIKTIEPWLPIITSLKEYSLTCSIRPIGMEKSVGIFNRYGHGEFVRYVDTSPMLVFFNNKTIKNGIKRKKSLRVLHS